MGETFNLIGWVIFGGLGIMAALWASLTALEGENPLEIIGELFHPPSSENQYNRWYLQDSSGQAKPAPRQMDQVYNEHTEPFSDPYSEETLEEIRYRKQVAKLYYDVFSGQEETVERVIEARSENRGERR